jgi:hypothetical protein
MATAPYSERLTSTEYTQQTMLSDLMQQRWLIALGIGIGILVLMRLRRAPEPQQAARRLVRDWRYVDDVEDARELLGSNLPPIMKPALLLALREIERQVNYGLRRLEREIEHL